MCLGLHERGPAEAESQFVRPSTCLSSRNLEAPLGLEPGVNERQPTTNNQSGDTSSVTVSHDKLTTMRRVRQRLSRIVFVWLLCQVSSVTAAPLLLAGQELCTCPTDVPGAACPMHHAHQDPNECVLRNAAP